MQLCMIDIALLSGCSSADCTDVHAAAIQLLLNVTLAAE